MPKTVYTRAIAVNPSVLDGARPTIWSFVRKQDADRVPVNIGDGTTRPLSTSYASLSAAQVEYPHATDLSDETAWAALYALLTSRPDGTAFSVEVPPGHYIINKTIPIGTRRVTIHMNGARIDTSVPLISVSPSSNHDAEDGGAYTIDGADPSASSIYFTGASGTCLDFERVVKGGVKNLTLREASGNGIGIRLYSADQIRLQNLHLFGFGTSIQASGPGKAGYVGAAYTRTNSCYLNDLFIRDYAECALDLSYVEEIFLTNVQSFVTNSTRVGKYAMKIGTSSFAVYGQTVSLMGGGLKVYWVPDANTEELPPNWLFFDNLLCDWPHGSSALHLDDSLYTPHSVLSLPARGYRFANSWFAATDMANGGTEPFEKLDALPNVYIGGARDVEFANCRIRAGKGHGVYVANCLNDLQFNNCQITSNGFNNPNFVNSSGIYIESNVGVSGTPGPESVVRIQVNGGVVSSVGSDDGGYQKYGIYSTSKKIHLLVSPNVALRGNTVAGAYYG